MRKLKKWAGSGFYSARSARTALYSGYRPGISGKGDKYRLRMPFKQIDSAIRMAARINALVFLDVQVGLSACSGRSSHAGKIP